MKSLKLFIFNMTSLLFFISECSRFDFQLSGSLSLSEYGIWAQEFPGALKVLRERIQAYKAY